MRSHLATQRGHALGPVRIEKTGYVPPKEVPGEEIQLQRRGEELQAGHVAIPSSRQLNCLPQYVASVELQLDGLGGAPSQCGIKLELSFFPKTLEGYRNSRKVLLVGGMR